MEFSFSDPVKVDAPADYELLPYSSCEKSVGEVFREIAEKCAENIALVDPHQQVTYQELNRKVNRVAHALLRQNLAAPTVVAFLLGRDIDAIAVILAILKAGFIYMALDPYNPREYLHTILDDAQPDLVITNNQYLQLGKELVQDRFRLLNLDESNASLPATEPDSVVNYHQLAAIFYTSGTAGQPKGVVMDHRALIHRTWVHLNLHCMSPHDRSPLPFPFSFAWSITPLFSSLFCGGTGFPCDLGRMQLNDLADWVDEKQLTIVHIPPSLLRQLLASLAEGRRFKSVRLMNVGSEALFPKDLAAWKKHSAPGDILAYGLASSELGTITRKFFNHQYEPYSDRLPVGYPVPTIKMKILDENGQPVKPNEVGEVAVQSWSSIRGYWNKAESARLIANREEIYRHSGDLGRLSPEGALEYHGRVDTIVKIRGYRVDTTEIVLALGGHPAVKESFAVAKPLPHSPENKHIVAYVVLKEGQASSVRELRIHLMSQLPAYKLPARFVFLDELPRTGHGKVNGAALPEPPARLETSTQAPGSPREEHIARIWRDLLGMDFVGVEDNFFDLGGDSLSALNMTLEVEKQTGVKVHSSFFQKPTISHLVTTLGKKDEDHTQPIIRTSTGNKNTLQASASIFNRLRKKYKPRHWLKVFERNLWSDQLIRLTPLIIRNSVLKKTYAEGNRWLMEWCSRPEAMRGLFKGKVELFTELVKSLENNPPDLKTRYPINLFGNMHRLLQGYSLWHNHSIDMNIISSSPTVYWKNLDDLIRRAPSSELDAIFPIAGMEFLEEGLHEKRGVILLSYHHSMDRLVSYVLQHRLGLDALITVSSVHAEKQSALWQEIQAGRIEPSRVAGMHAQAVNLGHRQLAKGGVIKIISDQNAKHGTETYRANIAGRIYHIRSGFADLALLTGARVIPYLCNIHPDSRISTTILPPLHVTGDDYQSQKESMLQQYAEFLTMCWKTAPETLFWTNIAKHLALPPNTMQDLGEPEVD